MIFCNLNLNSRQNQKLRFEFTAISVRDGLLSFDLKRILENIIMFQGQEMSKITLGQCSI